MRPRTFEGHEQVDQAEFDEHGGDEGRPGKDQESLPSWIMIRNTRPNSGAVVGGKQFIGDK